METARVLERAKELEHAHRNRAATGIPGPFSMHLLRRYVRGFWRPVFPVDAAPVLRPSDESVIVSFVGHATCQVVTRFARILIDPMLTVSLHGLRREVAAGIAAADLDDVSLILVTHAHVDRLHPPSLKRLSGVREIAVPFGSGPLVRGIGFSSVHEMRPDDVFDHGDVRVTAVPARHDGRVGLLGRWRAGTGYVVQGAQVAIYASGPTGYYSGFADIGRRLRPDVALLPITGYQPNALRAGNLSPLDAIYAFEDLKARFLVPVAHGSFPTGYEPAAEPLAWLRAASEERGHSATVITLGHGETLHVRREALPGAAPSATLDGSGRVG